MIFQDQFVNLKTSKRPSSNHATMCIQNGADCPDTPTFFLFKQLHASFEYLKNFDVKV